MNDEPNELNQEVQTELEEMLEQRRVATEEKKLAIKTLEDLDNDIKICLIQNGVETFEHDGYRMKIAGGINTTIVKAAVVRTLVETFELDPDEVEWFLEQVTKETPYDYIDFRKAGSKGGNGEK